MKAYRRRYGPSPVVRTLHSVETGIESSGLIDFLATPSATLLCDDRRWWTFDCRASAFRNPQQQQQQPQQRRWFVVSLVCPQPRRSLFPHAWSGMIQVGRTVTADSSGRRRRNFRHTILYTTVFSRDIITAVDKYKQKKQMQRLDAGRMFKISGDANDAPWTPVNCLQVS